MQYWIQTKTTTTTTILMGFDTIEINLVFRPFTSCHMKFVCVGLTNDNRFHTNADLNNSSEHEFKNCETHYSRER